MSETTKSFKEAQIAKLDSAIAGLVSWQNGSQAVIMAVAPALFKDDDDLKIEAWNVFEYFLDKLHGYGDRFKSEIKDVTLYFDEVLRLEVKTDDGGMSTVTSAPMTHVDGEEAFVIMRDKPWYKYRNKLLKEPGDKINTTSIARRVALGLMSMDEVKVIVDTLEATIAKESKSKKVVEFVSKWNEQEAA